MSEPVSSPDLVTQIAALFTETGGAHHEAYAATDGADPDWPIWYAGHLVDRLGPLLGATITKSELVYLVIAADRERAAQAPGASWPEYYARFFVARYVGR